MNTKDTKKSNKKEKNFEEKIEENIGSCFKGDPNRFGTFIGLIINIVILVLVNLYWDRISFFSPEFKNYLPYYNISVGTQVIVSFILLLINTKWFKYLGELITSSVSLWTTIILYRIFPFNFSEKLSWFQNNGRILLILVMIAICIAIIVNFIQFIISLTKCENKCCK